MRRTIARIVSAIALSAAPPCPRGLSGTPATAAAAAAASAGGDNSGISDTSEGSGVSGGGCAGVGGDFADAELPTAAPAMSLNLCVTDGRHIVCSRYRNHPRQDPPSLFVLSGAGFACEEEGSCLRLTAPGKSCALSCRIASIFDACIHMYIHMCFSSKKGVDETCREGGCS